MQEEFRNMFIKHIDISYKKCKEVWTDSVRIIEGKCRSNTYRCFGGFNEYEDDLKKAISFYQSKGSLGFKKQSFFSFSMKKEKQREEIILKMEEEGTKEEFIHLIDILKNSISELDASLDQFNTQLIQISSAILIQADNLDEFHKGSTAASISGNAVSAAGGITAVVGACLAPFTLGASLIVSIVGISVAALGSGTTVIAKTVDFVKKKKLCKEFQSMIEENIKNDTENLQNKVEKIKSVIDRLLYLKSVLDKDNACLPDTLLNVDDLAPEASFEFSRLAGLLGSARAVSVGLAALTRIAHVATGVLSGLFLILDAVFITQDAKDLHSGAKTDAAKEMRKTVDYFNTYKDKLYAFQLSCKEFYEQLLNSR
ncbi:apolipoprotein L1-like [Protopterus annectens]|uniref:apolipoprotein L1-like n=1 Tax=Protopterus annectens TaxID=7888 RepID=UPI001CFB6BD1|nr:apolipoprotein L1-like [Protopterus annectens]